MFGEPGGLYVYFAYGMHWCANLVCGPSGAASAVLMRAGEVVGGLEAARSRRVGVIDRDLARGPARLTMTLGLTADQNGIDTVATGCPLVLRAAAPVGQFPGSPGTVVRTGPRVGVSGPGGDATEYPWRFWLEGEATVSAYRPAAARPAKPPNGSGDP
jgi:DNA-3-methyladenine glycosylase